MKQSKIRAEIMDILLDNIIWGEKEKTVYASKIVPKIVKLFDSELLAKKKELIKSLPKEMNDDEPYAMWITPEHGYNQALSEVKKILKEI